MRRIDHIVIHCTATRPDQTASAKEIDAWHKARGWSGNGYHEVIRKDGSLEKGRPIEKPGAHVKGYNRHSIGIVYEGGYDAEGKPVDTRTDAQKRTMRERIDYYLGEYPDAELKGHNDFPNVNKACPCFNVGEWYVSTTRKPFGAIRNSGTVNRPASIWNLLLGLFGRKGQDTTGVS